MNKYWHELDPFTHHAYRFEFVRTPFSFITDKLFGRKIRVYIREHSPSGRTWRRVIPRIMRLGSWELMTRRELDQFVREAYHK